jgi:hypothetical protein
LPHIKEILIKYDKEGVIMAQHAENEPVIVRVLRDLFDDDVYPHVALLLSDEGAVIDALQEEGTARDTLGKVIRLMQTKLCPNYVQKQASA